MNPVHFEIEDPEVFSKTNISGSGKMVDDSGSFDLAEYFGQSSKDPFGSKGIGEDVRSICAILKGKNRVEGVQ